MKKRILTIFLSLILLSNLVPLTARAYDPDPNCPFGDLCQPGCTHGTTDNPPAPYDPDPNCPFGDLCQPGCTHGTTDNPPAPEASGSGPLSPQETFLKNHTVQASGKISNGNPYITYRNASGSTLTDLWDADGNKTSFTMNADGKLVSYSTISPQQTLRLSFANGIFASGHLWDWDNRTVTDMESLANDIALLTLRDLDGRNPSSTTLFCNMAMGGLNMEFEENPDGSKTWFAVNADGTRTPIMTVISDGTRKTEIPTSTGDALVAAVNASGAANVTIGTATGKNGPASEDPTGLTKTEVSIPGTTASSLADTGASLTVSSPVADVSIPNGGLTDLTAQGGDVTISAQTNGSTLEVTISAGGQTVDNVSGGVTVTVPQAGIGTDTVAAFIDAEGSPKAIPFAKNTNDTVSIPLNGSTTVTFQNSNTNASDGFWFANSIEYCANLGIISGSGSISEPSRPITNAEAAKMILTTLGYIPNVTEFFEGIDGTHDPDAPITQAQMAAMLWRYTAGSSAPSQGSTSWAQQQAANKWMTTNLKALSAQENAPANTLPLDKTPVIAAEACAMVEATLGDSITQFTKHNILLQAAQSMLSQANALPQGVLSMLQ